jgi:hypothetical protein
LEGNVPYYLLFFFIFVFAHEEGWSQQAIHCSSLNLGILTWLWFFLVHFMCSRSLTTLVRERVCLMFCVWAHRDEQYRKATHAVVLLVIVSLHTYLAFSWLPARYSAFGLVPPARETVADLWQCFWVIASLGRGSSP